MKVIVAIPRMGRPLVVHLLRDRDPAIRLPWITNRGRNLTTTRCFFCYHQNVRELRIARAFVAFICIALLLLCNAMGPSVAHLDLALPALVFCFLAVLRLSLLRFSYGDTAVQPISFLSVHTSRSPPLA